MWDSKDAKSVEQSQLSVVGSFILTRFPSADRISQETVKAVVTPWNNGFLHHL